MPLSSDTKKVFGMCLAIHFGFTEEVTEEENGREEGEGGEEEEKEVDESVDPSPLHSSVTTPEGWYYDPDPHLPNEPPFDPTDYGGPNHVEKFFADLDYKCAVEEAERSVCRLRFLLLQKG